MKLHHFNLFVCGFNFAGFFVSRSLIAIVFTIFLCLVNLFCYYIGEN